MYIVSFTSYTTSCTSWNVLSDTVWLHILTWQSCFDSWIIFSQCNHSSLFSTGNIPSSASLRLQKATDVWAEFGRLLTVNHPLERLKFCRSQVATGRRSVKVCVLVCLFDMYTHKQRHSHTQNARHGVDMTRIPCGYCHTWRRLATLLY